MAGKNTQIITMPEDGDVTYITPTPNGILDFKNIDLANVKVDIVGDDLIITDAATQSKIVLLGVALLMFEEDSTPIFLFDGVQVSPSDLLSDVGEIGNLNVEDFIAISSIIPEKDTDQTSNRTGSPESEDDLLALENSSADADGTGSDGDGEEGNAESTFISLSTALTNSQFDTTEVSETEAVSVDPFTSNAPPFAVDEEGEESSPFLESSSSSASSSSEDVTTAEFFDPPIPEEPVEFIARLLQVARIDTPIDLVAPAPRTILGGGGSDASFVNSANSAQASAETINTSDDATGVTIFADDPASFSDVLMTRVFEIEPVLGVGFFVSEISIAGLPAGFTLFAAGSLTPVALVGGAPTLFDPALNDRGAIEFYIQYDVPVDTTFTLDVSFDADFDDPSGELAVPLETSLTIEGELNFLVQEVNSASDYNFEDANGDTVFVLANNPNANLISTGAGDDIIQGGLAKDTISAGAGADQIEARDGNDEIAGGAGNDIIDPGLGNDIINGGDGQDLLDYSTLTDDITLELAELVNGFATAEIGNDIFEPHRDLVREIEDVTTGSGNDAIGGNDSANVLTTGAGDDTIFGSLGGDTLNAGDATDIDTLDYTRLDNAIVDHIEVTLADGAGSTIVTLAGVPETDTVIGIENITGTGGDDIITGNSSNNVLDGADGDDTLAGRGGMDTLDGGTSGSDTVDYSAAASNGVTVNLATQLTSNDGDGSNDVLVSIENITGSIFADNLTGDGNANIFDGGGDADTINAGGGDDTIIASDGIDIIDGQDDFDTIDYSNDTALVDGISVVLDGAVSVNVTNNTDVSTLDQIANVENITGTLGDDVFVGDGEINVLRGLGGDDRLEGGAGNDTLDGGTEGVLGDTADYSGLLTSVEVDLALGIAIDDGFGDTDTLIDIENLAGGGGSDILSGDAQDNIITGNGGDDTIYGAEGDDTIDGGGGTNDFADYSRAAAGIDVDMTLGSDQVIDDGFGDTDTLIDIENIRGSAFADTITGDAGANRLEGEDGIDTLDGGGGNDILLGGGGDDIFLSSDGADSYFGGDDLGVDAGIDTIDYSADGSATSITVVLNGGIAATVEVNGIGGGDDDTLIHVENVIGSTGNDDIRGDDQINIILGATGDDIIRGSLESDRLDGGTGGETTGDTLTYEDFATGSVLVNLNSGTAIYSLDSSSDDFSNFELYILTDQDDQIAQGTTGIDNVDLRGGNDTVIASAGADIYNGGSGSDTIDYSAFAAGNNITDLDLNDITPTVVIAGLDNDTLVDFENVIGTQGDDTITGDAEDNTLEGGAGDDTLSGGDGIDTIDGGADDDTLVGGDGADIIDGGTGTDRIDYSGVTTGVGVNVNLGGSEALNDGFGERDALDNIEDVTGTANADEIRGSGAVNDIIAGSGNDEVFGSAGADTIDGGIGNDDHLNYSELTGSGVALNIAGTEATNLAQGSVDDFQNFERYTLTDEDDTIIGSTGVDIVSSLDGDDVFTASLGADQFNAGLDDSAANGGRLGTTLGGDTIDYSGFGAGNNITALDLNDATATAVITGTGNDLLTGFENVIGTQGNDTIEGSGSNNRIITGLGDDIVFAGAGDDFLDGGGNNDTLRFDNLTGSRIEIDIGAGTAFYAADNSTDDFDNFENYFITNLDDIITGSGNAEEISGLDGDDIFNYSAGNDILRGGSGGETAGDTINFSSLGTTASVTVILNDTGQGSVAVSGGGPAQQIFDIENVVGTDAGDTITGDVAINRIEGAGGDDFIIASDGTDTLLGGTTNEAAGDTVDYSTLTNVNFITVTLNGNLDATVFINAGAGDDTINGFENIIGSTGNDIINGDFRGNVISGFDGDDTLAGRGGDDIIYGGTVGADTSTNDTVTYADASNPSGVTVDLGTAGPFQTTVDGDGGQDVLIGIENITGSAFGDTITGDALANVILGGGGDDTVFGTAGAADTLRGEGGDGDLIDYSLYTGVGLTITLNGTTDADVIIADATTLAEIKRDTISGFENIRATDEADVLRGDGNDNEIFGLGEDDRIAGGGGDDILDGGNNGAAGDTVFYNDASVTGRIIVDLSAQTATEDGQSGSDTLIGFENVDGSTNIALGDEITGSNVDNTLRGFEGDDTLAGLGGDDILDGGVDTANGDTVTYLRAAGAITVDIATGGSTVGGDGDGGTDTFINIENITGSDFDDSIRGDDNNNTLEGGLGDDTLYGAGGASDILNGGPGGSDTADYTDAAVGVTASLFGVTPGATVDGDGGVDTFISIENLTGSANTDNLEGDGSRNILQGGDGDDTLAGRGGQDDIYGGTIGSDTSTNDTVDYTNAANGVIVDLSRASDDKTIDDGDNSFDNLFGIENVTGSDNNDDITGDTNANILNGLEGDDTFSGGGGVDTITGGEIGESAGDTVDYSATTVGGTVGVNVDLANSVATVDGDGSNDILNEIENVIGSNRNDTLRGNADANTLTGLDGDDTFFGLGGDDRFEGGEGNETDGDTVDYADAINDVVADIETQTASDSTGGNDTLIDIENLSGGIGNDTLRGDISNNVLIGRGGDDILVGRGGNDTLDGGSTGTNRDTADYSNAANRIVVDLDTAGTFQTTDDGDGGQDILTDIEVIQGSSSNDIIYGDDNDNEFFGNGGEDTFYGGGGADTFDGSGTAIFGGGGVEIDTVTYEFAVNGVTADLTTGASNDGEATIGVDTFISIENLIGSDQNDTLTGSSVANVITGRDGDDTIIGSAGDDTLDGGTNGETNGDTISYAASLQRVDINLSTTQATGDEGFTDTITNFENAIGSDFDDELTGDANANMLDGGDGDDVFEYSQGGDTLNGGDHTSPVGDTVDYSGITAFGGTSISVTLDEATLTNVTIAGIAQQDQIQNIENVIGTSGDDTIIGDDADNVLTGNAGADELRGEGGDDTITGGADADVIYGGTGADSLDGGTGLAIDILRLDDLGGAGVEINLATTGVDSESVLHTATGDRDTFSNFEQYFLTNLDDVINGSTLADTVFALDGDDTFNWSTGIDVFDGGDHDTNGDTIDYSALPVSGGESITVDLLDDGAQTSVTVVGGSGNDLITNIENITGTDGNDTITGNNLDNILSGGAGNDTINAGEDGENELFGDAGDDTFFSSGGNNDIDGGTGDEIAGDTVDYSGQAGINRIEVNLNGSSFTNVDLFNISNVNFADDRVRNIENVIGGDGDDIIRGDGSDNNLFGGDGDDLLSGGAGLDVLDGGTNGTDGDTVDYSTQAGITTLVIALDDTGSATSVINGASEDTLIGIENITGSTGADTLTGSNSANTLLGLDDDDIFVGLDGADFIDGGDNGVSGDLVDYSLDTSVASVSVDLDGENTVTATITAAGGATGGDDQLVRIEHLTGTAGDDRLFGDASINILIGGSGDDELRGEAGNDRLEGGADTGAGDTAFYNDRNLAINVDLTVLNGDGSYNVNVFGGEVDELLDIENITGSSQNDIITGDANANTLDGSSGDDTIDGGAGNDRLLGGTGNDQITDGDGDDNVIGGTGDDTFFAGEGADQYNGGDGDDVLDYSLLTAATSITVDLETSNTIIVAGDQDDTITIGSIEEIIGTTGADSFTGDVSANIFRGGDNDDIFFWSDGDDRFFGDAGSDTIDFSSITVGFLDFTTSASAGAESSFNVNGNTRVRGTSIENIIGTDFDDNITINNDEFENINGGLGNDTISVNASGTVVGGGDGDDEITLGTEFGTDSGLSAFGNDDDDTFFVNGFNNDYDGGAGIDLASYEDNSRGIIVTLADNNAITTVNFTTGDAADTFTGIENIDGSGTNDIITGNADDNEIFGNGGGDILNGGDGDDTVNGGNDNDTIIASNGDDRYFGGNGTDTISYQALDTAEAGFTSIDINLNGTSAVTLNGLGFTHTISQFENVTATAGDDIIRTNSVNNSISAGDGDDTVFLSIGNDTLQGGSHIVGDTIDGSELAATISLNVNTQANQVQVISGATIFTQGAFDFERYILSSGDDTFRGDTIFDDVQAGAGNDTLFVSIGDDSLDGGDDSDTLSFAELISGVNATIVGTTVNVTGVLSSSTFINIENLTGTNADDILTGSSGVNVIDGGAGDDIIDGGGGADTLIGGANNAGGDTISYASLGTSVTVNLDGNTTSEAGTISGFENVTGGSNADILLGDANANVITGGGGNDDLQGFGGADTINAGAGADTLDGGDGDDTINGDSGANTFIASSGNDTYNGGTDTDILDYTALDSASSLSGISGTLGGSITLLGLGGTHTTSNIEELIATSGADDISGSANADVIDLAGGNDTLRVSLGVDTLDGGANTDTLSGSNLATSIVVDLSFNTATSGTITVDGDVQNFSNFELFELTNGDNSFTGTGGTSHSINALGGDDTFFITAVGTNVFEGGSNNAAGDTLNYAAISSNLDVTIAAGGGVTALIGGVASDTLTGFENVTGGTGNDALSGNSSANVINGGAGDDIINGGGGADTLIGGANNAGGDTLDYTGFGSAVTVDLDGSTTSAGGTISGFENVNGDTGDDTLTGNSSANVINGGAGDDIINGGGGADTLIGGANNAGGDTLDYTGFGSAVTVDLDGSTTSAAGTISGFENVTGGTGNDALSGNSSANVINGGAGDDVINGGGGADTLIGGANNAGGDTLDYTGFGSAVTVDLDGNTTSAGGTISGFENVNGDTGNDVLTGNSSANVINGGAGDDIIHGSGGADTINGGANTGAGDTLDYTGENSITTATFTSAGSVSVTNSDGTDTISGIENFTLSGGDDTISINTGAFGDFTNIDGGAGTADHVNLTGGSLASQGLLNGSSFDSLFNNIEELDFTGIDDGGAFTIGDDDVNGIAAGGELEIFVDIGTIGLADIGVFTQSATGFTDNTSGGTRTIEWDNGARLLVTSA